MEYHLFIITTTPFAIQLLLASLIIVGLVSDKHQANRFCVVLFRATTAVFLLLGSIAPIALNDPLFGLEPKYFSSWAIAGWLAFLPAIKLEQPKSN